MVLYYPTCVPNADQTDKLNTTLTKAHHIISLAADFHYLAQTCTPLEPHLAITRTPKPTHIGHRAPIRPTPLVALSTQHPQ